MPKFKKLMGNYSNIIAAFKLEYSYSDPKNTIQQDLVRTPFVDFNGKTIQSLRQTWEDQNVSDIYTQGNMTAASLAITPWLGHVFSDDNLDAKPQRTQKEPPSAFVNRKDLSFAYYDDQGIPCGFSLNYSKAAPSLWIAAIIHNTPVDPQKRSVTVFCSNEIKTEHPNAQMLTEDTVLSDILQTLGSSKIQQLLSQIIHPNGTVNIDALEQLEERIGNEQNIDNRDVKQVQLQKALDSMFASNPNDINLRVLAAKIKQQAAEDIHFYKEDNFLKILQSIGQLSIVIADKLNAFKTALHNLKNKANITDAEVKFHKKGLALYNHINNNLDTLTTQELIVLNDVIEKAIFALENPNDADTINNLETLRKTVSGQPSRFWKGLGAALLAFTGAALVVAGVLGAIPTGGVSLILIAAGAAALAATGGAAIYKGREHGFAKSITLFKEASKIPQQQNPVTVDVASKPNSPF